MRRLAVLVTIVTLPAAACSSAFEVDRGAPTIDRRDVEVWRGFIANHISSQQTGPTWAFAVETSRQFQGRGELLLRDSTEPQAAVFVDDVLRRNRQPGRLPVAELDHPAERIVWIGPAELPALDQADSARWQILSRRNPSIQRIWILTRPAYASGTRAFVIQREVCAPELAERCFRRPITLELRQRDGRWTAWRVQTIPPDSTL